MNRHQSQEKYKSISSEEATRNPTTNKKVIFYTPVQKRSQKRHYQQPDRVLQENHHQIKKNKKKRSKSLSESMYELKQKKDQYIRSSRYQQAKQVNNVLHYLERKRAKTQIKKLLSEHKKQRNTIKKAHLREMQNFENVWEHYFEGLKAKQNFTLINYNRSHYKDILKVQNILIDKCRPLKSIKGQIKSLQKVQKVLKKQQRFDQLKVLKRQKQKIKSKILKTQQEKIYSWVKMQQEHLKTIHTKKYNTLVSRIQQTHSDKYRQYQRQGHRLRQKYHNVLKKLEHSHKIEINQTVEKYPILKQNKNQRSFTLTI